MMRDLRLVPWLAASAFAAALALGACGVDVAVTGPATDAGPTEAAPPIDAPNDVVDGATGPMRAPYGLDTRPANPTCKAPARPPATSPVVFAQHLPNTGAYFTLVTITHIPGERTRWFGATTQGQIVTFPAVDPGVPTTPTVVAELATLAGKPVDTRGEGGLLGIAFHPKFAQNGYVYVSWTPEGPSASGMQSEVGRLRTTDNGASFGDYTPILGPFDQPGLQHKAGTALFGPDGYLYLSFGDGGSTANGQSREGFFSKILRIDVDNVPAGKTYGIPPGNPFATGGGEPATWAYGFRNPFRFSFDRVTGDLWVGDVGEGTYEEVDIVKPGGNYGWPCKEALHDFMPGMCDANTTLVSPVFEYSHTAYSAITGGIVYRGSQIPSMVGNYVFANFPDQAFYLSFDPITGVGTRTQIDSASASAYVNFAEDEDGELYGINFGGGMFKLTANGAPQPSTFPTLLSKTGCVDPTDPKKPAAGLVPYAPNAPFWSDGADKERYFALPDGATIGVGADGDFDFPKGTVLLKTFSLGGRRIETRLFVRHDDGEWGGYTYEWNDAQTDATLLPSSKSKRVGNQTWRFPSRSECVSCHTSAAGRSLGLELGQLNGDFVYTATNRISNQLATLEHVGLLAAPIGKPLADVVAYPKPTATAPLDARARAYLHTNCAQCHRPGGPTGVGMDLRFGTTLAMANACGAPERGDLGVADAKIITPGAPQSSILSLRPHATNANRMPPIASSVVDVEGLGVVDAWIKGLTTCP